MHCKDVSIQKNFSRPQLWEIYGQGTKFLTFDIAKSLEQLFLKLYKMTAGNKDIVANVGYEKRGCCFSKERMN